MTVVSACPSCGAPIYGPASIREGETPTVTRSCRCLPQLAPAVVQPAPMVLPMEPVTVTPIPVTITPVTYRPGNLVNTPWRWE